MQYYLVFQLISISLLKPHCGRLDFRDGIQLPIVHLELLESSRNPWWNIFFEHFAFSTQQFDKQITFHWNSSLKSIIIQILSLDTNEQKIPKDNTENAQGLRKPYTENGLSTH